MKIFIFFTYFCFSFLFHYDCPSERLKSIPTSLNKSYKNKKFGYKPPKSTCISLSKPYKISGFSTVAHSFCRAIVHQQTKLIQFYIIFSLSLTSPLSQLRTRSDEANLSQLRARSRRNSPRMVTAKPIGANMEQTHGFWCWSGAMEELWVLSGADLVLWRSRGFWMDLIIGFDWVWFWVLNVLVLLSWVWCCCWRSRGCWVDFRLIFGCRGWMGENPVGENLWVSGWLVDFWLPEESCRGWVGCQWRRWRFVFVRRIGKVGGRKEKKKRMERREKIIF